MLATLIYAHSYLSKPTGRTPAKQVNGGPGAKNCGAAKGAYGGTQTFQRGAPIPTSWARNNHAGGFMRYSIVPFANSDIDGIFDDQQHVFHYECAEKVCKSGGDDPNGGDPSSEPFSNMCTGEMTIPTWVPDGQYTIQAGWYATGNSYGDKYRGQWQFFTCVDATVTGGAAVQENEFTAALKSVTPSAQCKSAATFTQGDVTGTSGCKWFTGTTGKIHGCNDNACKCSTTSGPDAACYQRGPPPEFCGTASAGTTPAAGTNNTVTTPPTITPNNYVKPDLAGKTAKKCYK